MPTKRSFLYEIEAQYKGESEVRKLSSDLTRLGKIRAFDAARQSMADMIRGLDEARRKQAELAKAVKSGGGKEIERQYKTATREVDRLSASIEKQSANLRVQRAALRESGVSTQQLAMEQKKAEAAARAQGETVARMAKLGIRSERELKAEVAALNKAYRDLKASGAATTSDLARAKQQLTAKTAKLNAELKGTSSASRAMGDMVNKVGLLVSGFSALAAASGAVRTFVEFDDIMREVGAKSNATNVQLADLTAVAREMGATTRYSATEAGEGLKFLAQAGFSVEKQIAALPTVLNLATAGATDLGTTSDIVTNIMTGMGVPVDDLAAKADILAKAFTTSNSDLTQLGTAFSYAGPVAHSAGMSFEETATVLAKLHDAGIQGSRAGTALRGSLARLMRQPKMVADALSELGVEVFDSSGKMRGFIDILADIERAGASPTQAIKIFGQEAGPGMMALLGQGTDSLRAYEATLHEAGGTTDRIAKDMEAGLGGSLRSLKSATEGVAISFGEAMAPAIAMAAEWMTDLARGTGQMTDLAVGGVEAVRALHNGWLGLKLIVNGAIAGVATFIDLVWQGFRGAMAPIELMIAGLRKLGLIDFNPFEGVAGALDDFKASSREVLRQNVADIDSANAKYDQAVARIKGASDARERERAAAEDAKKALEEEARVNAENLDYFKQAGVLVDATTTATEEQAATVENRLSPALVKIGDTWINVNSEVEAGTKAVNDVLADTTLTGGDLAEVLGEDGVDAIAEMNEQAEILNQNLALAATNAGNITAGTQAFLAGGRAPAFASGGRAPGAYPGRDNMLAWIHSEEGMTPAPAMRALDRAFGRRFFDEGLRRAHTQKGMNLVRAMLPPTIAMSAPPGQPRQAAMRPIVLPPIYGNATVLADQDSVGKIMSAIDRATRNRRRFGQ